MSLESWLRESERQVEELRAELAAMQDSAVRGVLAINFSPELRPGIHTLFRLENDAGQGPWTMHSRPKFNGVFSNPNYRWAVHEIVGFRDALWSWGAICFERKGFEVVEYSAVDPLINGAEAIFDITRAKRVRVLDRSLFHTANGFIERCAI